MITGQQALQSIEQAALQMRGQEGQLAAALQSADAELAQRRADRAALYRQLAQLRLDAIQRETIVFDLDAAERRALDLIKQAKGTGEQLVRRIGEAEARLRAAEQDRHVRADAVAKAMEALESMQAGVEQTVRAAPDWLAQKAAVDRSAEIAEAAERKASQAEADREAKRKPYEGDVLFMYLWNRRFGTAEYGSTGIVRYLDRKVADLVGFQDARPNYVMLNEIPTRLREHAERCKADVEAERAKLVAVEKAGLAAAGSAPLEEAYAKAQADLAQADAALSRAQADLQALDAERERSLRADGGNAFAQAIEIVAEADSRETIRELYREASQTRTTADDAVVAEIEKANGAIALAEQESQRLRQQAAEITKRRADVEAQRDAFRQRGWDNPMGRIGNENVLADVLGGILKGAVQGAVLGQVLKGGFSQRPPRADSGFGGDGGFTIPWPPGGPDTSGGWGGGGGWGGDSGGFGGDSGGDGFRTGGSF